MASLLDIRTLTVASAVTIAVLFALLVYFWRTRQTYPGFGLWTLGALAMSAGLTLLALRGFIPDPISILGGNCLMMLDIILIYRGLAAFAGLARRTLTDALFLAVYMALIYWYSAYQPSFTMRVVVLSLGFSWYLSRSALIVAGPVTNFLGSRNWMVLVVFIGIASYYALRVPLALLGPAIPENYLASNPLLALTLLTSLVAHVLVINGLIMLNVQRLEWELNAAKGEVRMLSGLLPICSGCKRIRDEQGGWQPIEAYISGHSQAEFSHGICPDCLRKHYPEVAKNVLEK